MTMQQITRRINVMRPLCRALVGKNHSTAHHLALGALVMVIGVVINHVFGHSHIESVAFAGELVGNGIHGLGLTPFVEYIFATEA